MCRCDECQQGSCVCEWARVCFRSYTTTVLASVFFWRLRRDELWIAIDLRKEETEGEKKRAQPWALQMDRPEAGRLTSRSPLQQSRAARRRRHFQRIQPWPTKEQTPVTSSHRYENTHGSCQDQSHRSSDIFEFSSYLQFLCVWSHRLLLVALRKPAETHGCEVFWGFLACLYE